MKSYSICRSSDISYAADSILDIRYDLVHTRENNYLIRSVNELLKFVSVSIDIYELTVKSDSIGTHKKAVSADLLAL